MEIIEKRDTFNLQLMRSFDEFFAFTDVYFFYDADSELMHQGQYSNIFLNDSLQKYSLDLSTDQDVYFLLKGFTSKEESIGIEAYYLTDKHLESLKKPFPYYVKSSNFFELIDRMLSPGEFNKNYCNRIARKLNKQLNKFYQKQTGS